MSSREAVKAWRWIISVGVLISAVMVMIALQPNPKHAAGPLDIVFIVAYSFAAVTGVYRLFFWRGPKRDFGVWMFPVGMFSAIFIMFALVITPAVGWAVATRDAAITGVVFTALICAVAGLMHVLEALKKRGPGPVTLAVRRLSAGPRARVRAFYSGADKARPEDFTDPDGTP